MARVPNRETKCAIIKHWEFFVVTASYKTALQMAISLSPGERSRLIQELAGRDQASDPPHSILELCGLGKESWEEIDAQQYVRNERLSWNG
jgi:hypothetical protein